MTATIGPFGVVTLLTDSTERALDDYANAFGWRADAALALAPELASTLDLTDLAGTRVRTLRDARDRQCVRLIEAQALDRTEPMHRDGWLALELLVDSVDATVARLPAAFNVLGAPADLDVSPSIRAAQVLGPCNELYYLTQVRAAVPPFDLPQSGVDDEGLFIAVLRCADRDGEIAWWRSIGGGAAFRFDTRITVVNRALGLSLATRHPIGVVQLAARSLVEIDQIAGPVWSLSGTPRAAGVWAIAIDAADPRPRPSRSPAGCRIEWQRAVTQRQALAHV